MPSAGFEVQMRSRLTSDSFKVEGTRNFEMILALVCEHTRILSPVSGQGQAALLVGSTTAGFLRGVVSSKVCAGVTIAAENCW